MTTGGNLFSVQFWKETAELAVRGAASGFITATGGSAFDVWHMQWKTIGGFTFSGALVSVAFSLIGKQRGEKNSPLMTAKPVGDG